MAWLAGVASGVGKAAGAAGNVGAAGGGAAAGAGASASTGALTTLANGAGGATGAATGSTVGLTGGAPGAVGSSGGLSSLLTAPRSLEGSSLMNAAQEVGLSDKWLNRIDFLDRANEEGRRRGGRLPQLEQPSNDLLLSALINSQHPWGV